MPQDLRYVILRVLEEEEEPISTRRIAKILFGPGGKEIHVIQNLRWLEWYGWVRSEKVFSGERWEI